MGLIENTPVPISQYEDEFSILLDEYKRQKPKTILEIGTHHGGTLYHWITEAPDGATILSIDNQHINCDLYSVWANKRVYVDYYKGDSTSYSAIDYAIRNYCPYDWIFIDGDHSYKGVKHDWEASKAMISSKGIIAFHDILPHPPWNEQPVEVEKLWSEIKKEYKTKEIIGKHIWPDMSGIGVVYFD